MNRFSGPEPAAQRAVRGYLNNKGLFSRSPGGGDPGARSEAAGPARKCECLCVSVHLCARTRVCACLVVGWGTQEVSGGGG